MRLTRLGITANLSKTSVRPLTKKILAWCRRHNILPCVDPGLLRRLSIPEHAAHNLRQPLKKSDLILSLGGDGYLLTLARELYPCSVPILPVNLGSLGFNAQCEPDELFKVLRLLRSGNIHFQKRMLLAYRVSNAKKTTAIKGVALNDVIIHKNPVSRLLHLHLTVDALPLTTYRTDGLLVSSPTGSTAYNLAAQGPILHPEAKGVVITPINPHCLHSRCIIIPERSSVEITHVQKKKQEEAVLSVDGQLHRELHPDDTLHVRKAPTPLTLAAPHPDTFYHNLRNKLLWGGSIIDAP